MATFGHPSLSAIPEDPKHEVPDPDRLPSSGFAVTEDRDNYVICVLRVDGLGAIVLRAPLDDNGDPIGDCGISTFTPADIGDYKD